ncbi:MAG: hypothetical protein KA401_02030 [Anaerolineae bacterium]|nr:hypothetical protein [Chloroflexota bacterium]MBP6298098.1 hypothetical protein [Anaerolineae bacterium]
MSAPVNLRVFEKRSEFKTTASQLEAFHQDPTALRKLTPPPIIVQVHSDHRQSLTEGDLIFTLWFGFLPVRWHARHEAAASAGFADIQISGPMSFWRHEHLFEATESGAALIDRVTYAHKSGFAGLMTKLMFDGLPLRFLFFYRHMRTRQAVER